MDEPRTEQKKRYELVVPFDGDQEGANEFAQEVATEFGCKVVVIDEATGEDTIIGEPNGKGMPYHDD